MKLRHLSQYGHLGQFRQTISKSSYPSVVVNKVLLEHRHAHLFAILSVAVFTLQQGSCLVATQTVGPQSLKYLIHDPLQEKFANSWFIETNLFWKRDFGVNSKNGR